MATVAKKGKGRSSAKVQPRGGIFAALSTNEPSQLMVIGRNGTAKVELMKELVLDEIASGNRCVFVVDTAGQLFQVLEKELAESGLKRNIILIDPVREEGQPFSFLIFNNEADASRKSEALVDAFRTIYLSRSDTREQTERIAWTSYTDRILQYSLLLLMYTQSSLHDLPLLLSNRDFRDLLLEKFQNRRELSQSFRDLLNHEWSEFKTLCRTDRWVDWIEPLLACTKLLLRPELSYMLDLNVPWLEKQSPQPNVIMFKKARPGRPEGEPAPPESQAARKSSFDCRPEPGIDLPEIVEQAIAASYLYETQQEMAGAKQQSSETSLKATTRSAGMIDLEELICSKKVVLINLSLSTLHMDVSHLAEAVAALFISSLIGASRNLWSRENEQTHDCAIFSSSFDNIVSTRTIHRICRDQEKYRVSLRLCSNALPVKSQESVDKLVDDLGNLAVFAIPRADAELLGHEVFRCSNQGNDRSGQLMKQGPRSYCFYQARTGQLSEGTL